MKLLKKATNNMAYGKIGLYGEAGSGKTFTAALLAIGLHQFAKLTKPVAMFDTEPAAKWIKPLFDKAGIEFVVADQSRALADLMNVMDEAEQECSIIIIDSITHVWKDVQDSYIKKINQKRQEQRKPPIYQLEFHHWRPIKSQWARFTDRFLSSKLHCIVCGRAGSIYEYQQNDTTGKKELITTGTKMATEKEMGYEPSLLIELVKHYDQNNKNKSIINRAIVEKDRANLYNGNVIDWPKFESFKKHFELLDIGGEHFGSMQERDSSDLYNGEGEDTFAYERRQRDIWCEEIKGLLIEHSLDGSGAEAKKQRVALLEQVFNTKSWTAIESMNSDKIKAGFLAMKDILTDKDNAA